MDIAGFVISIVALVVSVSVLTSMRITRTLAERETPSKDTVHKTIRRYLGKEVTLRYTADNQDQTTTQTGEIVFLAESLVVFQDAQSGHAVAIPLCHIWSIEQPKEEDW